MKTRSTRVIEQHCLALSIEMVKLFRKKAVACMTLGFVVCIATTLSYAQSSTTTALNAQSDPTPSLTLPISRNSADPKIVQEALRQQRGLQDGVSERQNQQWIRQENNAVLLRLPRSGRLTDSEIHQDFLMFEEQQNKINSALKQYPKQQYALGKAQCWLDVSFHEYTRKDRSSFVPEAFLESRKITEALANKSGEPWLKTPYLNQSQNYKSLVNSSNLNSYNQTIIELEAKLQEVSQSQQDCSPAVYACAEVEAKHAVNEYTQGGFRHAQPYLLIGEQYLTTVLNCKPPEMPAPVVVAVVAPTPVSAPVPPPVIAPPLVVEIPQRVHFAFDLWGIAPTSAKVLDKMVIALKANPDLKLKAVGHTDIRASNGYNIELSLRRVSSVMYYLRQAGIPAGQVQMGYDGRAKPDKPGSHEGDHQYNRRVVFEVIPGPVQVKLIEQNEDLQPCGKLTLLRCPVVNHAPQDKIIAQDMFVQTLTPKSKPINKPVTEGSKKTHVQNKGDKQ